MTDFPVQFGRYQLLERLAVGGMAELFKARVVGAHGFQKTVVIKKILPHLAGDPSFVNMFIDEAKITARLDHPKIAQVLELGTLADNLYIAMEFVEGVDALAILRAFAQRKQPIPAHLAVHICHEVLDALDHAHQARDDAGKPLGIVHRDISPSNVLISRRGDVKLADFGIAHALDRQQRTQAGMLKGKYGYMSPEQVIGGDIDARSDLFSVGIILAEMLMGRRLFSAPNELDVLLMVRDVRLDRLGKYGNHIPAELLTTLGRALQRAPSTRFQSAVEFREELAEYLFRSRQRVGPTDLAALVESIGPVPKPAPAPAPAPVAAEAHVQAVPRAVSVGAEPVPRMETLPPRIELPPSRLETQPPRMDATPRIEPPSQPRFEQPAAPRFEPPSARFDAPQRFDTPPPRFETPSRHDIPVRELTPTHGLPPRIHVPQEVEPPPSRTPVPRSPTRVGVGEGLVARVGDPLGESQVGRAVPPAPTGRTGVGPSPLQRSTNVPALHPPGVDPALDRTVEATPVRHPPGGAQQLDRTTESPAIRTGVHPTVPSGRTPVGPSPLGAPTRSPGPSPLTRSAELPAQRTPVPAPAPSALGVPPTQPPPSSMVPPGQRAPLTQPPSGPPPAAPTEQMRPAMPSSVTATPVPPTRQPPATPVPRSRRISSEIPIIVEDIGHIGLDEPVVPLRNADRKSAISASDSEVPILLETEQSQPVVTIERFPDALLENDLEAELEKELSDALGPLDEAKAPAVAPERRRGEADFLDLSVELGLEMPEEGYKRPITGTRIPSVEALIPATRTAKATEQPDELGDLAATSPIRVLYRLAVDKASGLLVVEVPSGREGVGVVKEIFFALGNPEYVTSNLARELFGEYLVSQRVISPGELAMALAMMPHFGGRLGDTLVGLGLLKPLDVFRHLTRQVREKIVDVCTWQKGTYRWYRGKRVARDSFPLGLDAFEVLGAGATALPGDLVEAWADPSFDRLPVAAKNGRVVPEAFRLGTYPRDVYNRLDGRNSLRQLLARFTSNEDRLAFLRTLYLLNQTELAYWV